MFTRSILNSYHEEVNLTELPIMASVHGSLILHFLGLETLLQPQVFPQAPSGNSLLGGHPLQTCCNTKAISLRILN